MGLSQYREVFMVTSLLSFAVTTSVMVYGTAKPKRQFDILKTVGLSLLAIISGLFLFVLP